MQASERDMLVMDGAFGQLVINIRSLAQYRDAFDREAQRILAGELRSAALRIDPRFMPRFVRSNRYDSDGQPLYRFMGYC